MKIEKEHPIRVQKPKWLRRKLPTGPEYEQIRQLLQKNGLTTVCQEAQCPNQFECFSKGTATFMILGQKCTRNCTFCAVGHTPDSPPDKGEPQKVAEAVAAMGLKYAVVTSVTRDDLEDGGASFFVKTILEIRKLSPLTLVEILIPDLQGNWDALQQIVEAEPDVLNHNIETIPRLYKTVRPQAVYERSLELIGRVKRFNKKMVTKSGIMLGLGETRQELLKTLDDLLGSHCDILTLGQYLQPSKAHLAVEEFVTPEEFSKLKEIALRRGFLGVAAGPAVRSSYEAGLLYRKVSRKILSTE
jgi:lipoic acid synthetase